MDPVDSGTSSAAAASIGLTTAPSAAPEAPRGLAAAVRPVGSAVVGPAAPVVAQAAAPTPRAAAVPGAGATAALGADTAAGGDWGALWGAFRGGAFGDAFGRRLALLLVLLAGHLGGQVQELRKTDSGSDQHTETSFMEFHYLVFPPYSKSLVKNLMEKLSLKYSFSSVFTISFEIWEPFIKQT